MKKRRVTRKVTNKKPLSSTTFRKVKRLAKSNYKKGMKKNTAISRAFRKIYKGKKTYRSMASILNRAIKVSK